MMLLSYNLAIKSQKEDFYKIADIIRFNSAWFTKDELKIAVLDIKGKSRFIDIHLNRNKDCRFVHDFDELLIFCGEFNIEWVGLSNVINKEMIINAKGIINNNFVKVCSKIESENGVKNIDEIIDISDGIMVDIEDLSADMGWEKAKEYSNYIYNKCVNKVYSFKLSGVVFSVTPTFLN